MTREKRIYKVLGKCYNKKLVGGNMLKEVKIELTEQCNRMCIHCSSDAKKLHYLSLPFEMVEKILWQARELGATSVAFTGGEATLYPNLEKVFAKAQEVGLESKLYTMMTPDEASLSQIQALTFYGLSEVIYSTSYRLTRDQVVTKNALETFFPLLLEKTSVTLGVHHVVTKETMKDVDSSLQLFFSLPQNRTSHFSLLRYIPHGRGDSSLLLSYEDTLLLRRKIEKWKKQYGEKIRLGSPWNYLGISHTPCTAATDTMIVGFDGSVYPCDAMKYFDYLGSGGNIYEHSLEEIYQSPYFEKVRASKELLLEDCSLCPQSTICKGGCLGQKMVSFMDTSHITFRSYGEQAIRTMRDFSSREMQRMNGELGLVGELGEFIDSFKKYKTHGIDEESKEKLKKNLVMEAGDILWYLPASLGTSYGVSFAEVGSSLFSKESLQKKHFSDSLLEACAKSRDPECLFQTASKEIPLAKLDTIISSTYQFAKEWKSLVAIACRILYASKKEELLEEIGDFLVSLSTLVYYELGVSMEEIARQNIEKLKIRYQSGYDSEIASSRVTLLTDYKREEPDKSKPYQKKI